MGGKQGVLEITEGSGGLLVRIVVFDRGSFGCYAIVIFEYFVNKCEQIMAKGLISSGMVDGVE